MATNAITFEEAQAELEQAEAELLRQQEEVEKLRAFVHGYEAMLLRRGGDIKQTQKPRPSAPKAGPKPAPSKRAPAPTPPGRKLTVEELAVQELEREGSGNVVHIDALTERMIAAGYEPRGTGKPKDAVYATLYHVSKRPESRIFRDRASFGLRA